MCKFIVVPGKRQALLGVPNIDTLNIININSICTEHSGGNDNCCTNKATSQSADMTPERQN